eukprot:TRINITY_DN5117_c0_g1_i1.p1 TRINITY_DN5117_c0_g1~~TRINITY_DN5117_c0_g1_i1.p1  ORF type:complete len:376 (-),score=89.89 TRINITY_DN5117_c0_g1_i1:82-1209(-)
MLPDEPPPAEDDKSDTGDGTDDASGDAADDSGSPPRKWREGLPALETLIGTSPLQCEANTDETRLLSTIASTCATLSYVQRNLMQIAKQVQDARAAGRSLDSYALCDAVQLVSPTCTKAATLLNMMSGTLASFAGTCNTTFLSSQFGSLTIHTTSPPHKKPQLTQTIRVSLCNSVERPLIPGGLEHLKQHDHACFSYATPEQGMFFTLQMFYTGLVAGAGFLMLRSQLGIDQTLQAMSDAGYNTKALLDSGRVAATSNDVYLGTQELSGEERLRWALNTAQSVIARSGCSQVHVISELAYFPQPATGTAEESALPVQHQMQREQFRQDVIQYEKLLSPCLYGSLPMTGVCLFERAAFPTNFLADLECVHPVVLSE